MENINYEIKEENILHIMLMQLASKSKYVEFSDFIYFKKTYITNFFKLETFLVDLFKKVEDDFKIRIEFLTKLISEKILS